VHRALVTGDCRPDTGSWTSLVPRAGWRRHRPVESIITNRAQAATSPNIAQAHANGRQTAGNIEPYFKSGLGRIRLVDLRDQHFEDLYTAMRQLGRPNPPRSEMLRRPQAARRRRPRPITPARLLRVHATVRSALNTAAKKKKPLSPRARVSQPCTKTGCRLACIAVRMCWSGAEAPGFEPGMDGSSRLGVAPCSHLGRARNPSPSNRFTASMLSATSRTDPAAS
jgi:hypothetical protein